MKNTERANVLIDHLFRHEHGKMVAVLTKIFGIQHLEIIEDVVQDAFQKALSTWRFNGPPQNPSAWLMTVARNRAIDVFRKLNRQHFVPDFHKISRVELEEFYHENEIADSQLRLIFTCCHPSLKESNQIAFTLKALSGFSIKEISKALLTSKETIKKRLHRARQKIIENEISFDIPTGSQLKTRTSVVLKVLYLLFNEGYQSSKSNEIIRKELCIEAMRLCKLMVEQSAVNNGDSQALLALMCFHAARFESRVDSNQNIVLLEDQDRSKWSPELINIGNHFLNKSIESDHYSYYHLEAAIAAEHCLAKSFQETRWDKLHYLYALLYKASPSPMVLLNKIIVELQLGHTDAAYQLIQSIDPKDLGSNQYLLHSVYSEIYGNLEDKSMQKHHLQKAFDQAPTIAEKNLLDKKLSLVE